MSDYTLKLAEECSARGHQCSILAVNNADFFFSEDISSVDELKIPLKSLDLKNSPRRSAQLAREFVASQETDCISLQFVCYDFGPRGIITSFTDLLSSLLLAGG